MRAPLTAFVHERHERTRKGAAAFRLFRNFRGSFLSVGLLALSGLSSNAAEAISPEAIEFFENKIRPVLASECYECHNAEKTKGGLRLDYRDGWKKGGDSGGAIVPGNAKDSLLIQSIRHEDPDLKMPAKAPKLEDHVIADFEKWVNMGAPDPRDQPPSTAQGGKPAWPDLLASRRGWWSLQPVIKPELPVVKNEAWSSDPVDRFILEKMEGKGLTPAAPADARTFIRRLTFTLTGLPPTPAEVEAFVNEAHRSNGSHETYKSPEKAVDRLLASPRFGEHWARHWMDLMRYAETHGSEGDPEIREAWRFRDYLIRAFNGDVPADQLIREHLAGDLLPQPRMNPEGFSESILGTAQFRLVEHGFQPVDTLDDQVKAVDNQIDVVSKAFQGLTISCARCHDHKFDAISERDYYALYGIFAACRPAQVTIDAPEVRDRNRVPLDQLHGRIKTALADAWLPAASRLGERLQSEVTRVNEQKNIAAQVARLEQKVADLEWTARRSIKPETGTAAPAAGAPAPLAVWTFDKDASDSLGKLNGHLEGDAEIKNGRLVLDGVKGYLRTDPLTETLKTKTLEAWVSMANLEQGGAAVIGVENVRVHGFDSIVFGEKFPGQWLSGSNHFARTESAEGPVETAPPGQLVHVAISYAADGTIALYRNGVPYGHSYSKAPLLPFPAADSRVLIGLRHTGRGFLAGEVEEARLYDRALTPEEIAASFRAGTPPFVSAEQITAALADAQRVDRAALQEAIKKLRAARPAGEDKAWTAALSDAATNPANPFHLWAQLRDVPVDQFGKKWSELTGKIVAQRDEAQQFNRENFRPLWNLAGDDYAQWFPTGSGLPQRPFAAGEFSIEPEGERVLSSIAPAGLMTNRLSEKHNGLLTSPRFKLASDSISVRASGGDGAMIRVIVDNYPLPSNPIFPKAVLEKDEPAWIRLDTAYRKGNWAYLEIGTRQDVTRPLAAAKTREAKSVDGRRSFFQISEVVTHDTSEKPREEPLALLPLLDGPAPRDVAELATRYARTTERVVAAWRDDQLTAAQAALLDSLVRSAALPVTLAELPVVRPLVADYRRLEAEVPELRRAPGLLETAGFDSPLLPRGDHLKPANLVPRAYLEVFGGKPYHTSLSGRLELAAEIANAQNPLTARVMVNRVWHWMFGRGIVPTVDNFGRLGEKPTHPELLDFLAARFVEEGWSFKKLIRELALTHTFQMSSEPAATVREIDPTNELLSHFRIQRLPAEAIRDSLVLISGGMDDKMFGPPEGANAVRRSVYLAVRRTFLNPFLQTFDAPKPFTTLGRRDATNVPGQSLTMLNSPFVIDRAMQWSRRLLRDGSVTAENRIDAMFAAAFARRPGDEEIVAAKEYLNLLAEDRKVSADQLLASEPVWQDFAQSLFNLKEFIYVR